MVTLSGSDYHPGSHILDPLQFLQRDLRYAAEQSYNNSALRTQMRGPSDTAESSVRVPRILEMLRRWKYALEYTFPTWIPTLLT